MLLKFKVKNFKKFKDELIFDLTKCENYSFNEDILVNDVLNKALIYGSNGSGKSNLGLAIFDIINHITDNTKKPKKYENYLYGNGIASEEAKFSYEFKIDNTNFVYNYVKDKNQLIIKEELFKDLERVLYIDKNLEAKELSIPGSENLNLENILSNDISLLKYVFNNILFEEQSPFIKLKQFINSMLWFRSVESMEYIGYKFKDIKDWITGILDLNSIENNNNLDKQEKRRLINQNLNKFKFFLEESNVNLDLVLGENNGKETIYINVEGKKIPYFKIISTGTINLTFFYVWYKKLEKNSFVFIDEFDSNYHYKLSKLIINKLKKIRTTQIVLTTHSTTIIDNELLRPDSYFILKNNTIKSLSELTNKELREAHNIEKLFKSGAFDE